MKDENLLLGSNVLNLLGMTSYLWDGFMNAFKGAIVDTLWLTKINFCPLASAELERLTTLNVCADLFIRSCRLLSKQITDSLLMKLSRMRLQTMTISHCTPVDRTTFEASDDGALALFFPSSQPRQAERMRPQVHLPAGKRT